MYIQGLGGCLWVDYFRNYSYNLILNAGQTKMMFKLELWRIFG